MFEKEAEEYATRECCMTCNNINHFCKEKCECWTFAKKGAEFGYNKANERLIKANEIIEGLMRFCRCFAQHHTEDIRYKEAEQFISEVEK